MCFFKVGKTEGETHKVNPKSPGEVRTSQSYQITSLLVGVFFFLNIGVIQGLESKPFWPRYSPPITMATSH